jgi:hypothetical protein
MKNALISPNESVSYISGWTEETNHKEIRTTISNAYRIAEVNDSQFEVANPLFWVECPDDIISHEFYYDSVTKTFIKIPDTAPYPELTQPSTTGSQNL